MINEDIKCRKCKSPARVEYRAGWGYLVCDRCNSENRVCGHKSIQKYRRCSACGLVIKYFRQTKCYCGSQDGILVEQEFDTTCLNTRIYDKEGRCSHHSSGTSEVILFERAQKVDRNLEAAKIAALIRKSYDIILDLPTESSNLREFEIILNSMAPNSGTAKALSSAIEGLRASHSAAKHLSTQAKLVETFHRLVFECDPADLKQKQLAMEGEARRVASVTENVISSVVSILVRCNLDESVRREIVAQLQRLRNAARERPKRGRPSRYSS